MSHLFYTFVSMADGKNFRRKEYFKVPNFRGIVVTLAFFSFLVLFKDFFLPIFSKGLVSPFFAKIKPSYLNDALVFTALIAGILYLIYNLEKRRYPTLQSLIMGALWLSFFRLVAYHYFSLTPTKVGNVGMLNYASLLAFTAFIYLASYKRYLNLFQKEISSTSLYSGSSGNNPEQDLIGNNHLAAAIAKFITGSLSETSIAVAISGSWGAGKSDLLFRCKRELIQLKDKNLLLVEFNPWRVTSEEAIISEFFTELGAAISKYDSNLSKNVLEYSKKVMSDSGDLRLKSISHFAEGVFHGKESHDFDRLNEAIQISGMRIVILIDDLDRLTGTEALAVLRLIRNTASFGNTFFIVCADEEYLADVLQNSKKLTNEAKYLDKIFQLRIHLPTIDKSQFVAYLKELVSKGFPLNRAEKIGEAIDRMIQVDGPVLKNLQIQANHRSLIELCLSTFRDLKHLANAIRFSLHLTSEESELTDLFALTMLKMLHPKLHEELREGYFLQPVNQKTGTYVVEPSKLKTYLDDHVAESIQVASIMDFLFYDAQWKSPRKLLLARNFSFYFTYHLFQKISFQEFQRALYSSPKKMAEDFLKWAEKGYSNLLYTLLKETVLQLNFEDKLNQASAILKLRRHDGSFMALALQWLVKDFFIDSHSYFGADDGKHSEEFIARLPHSNFSYYELALIYSEYAKFASSPNLPNIPIFRLPILRTKVQTAVKTSLELVDFFPEETTSLLAFDDIVNVLPDGRVDGSFEAIFRDTIRSSSKVADYFFLLLLRPGSDNLAKIDHWPRVLFPTLDQLAHAIIAWDPSDDFPKSFKSILLSETGFSTSDQIRTPVEITVTDQLLKSLKLARKHLGIKDPIEILGIKTTITVE